MLCTLKDFWQVGDFCKALEISSHQMNKNGSQNPVQLNECQRKEQGALLESKLCLIYNPKENFYKSLAT